MSDYQLEDTIYLPFTTRAFATGIPTALVSGVIEIYEDASLTQITAAETTVASLDAVVGFNMITVVATAANGFGLGQSYTAVLSAGTVDSVSVVGEVVGHFTLDMSAAAKDLANATDGLGAVKADTAATLVDTGTTIPGTISTLVDEIWDEATSGHNTGGTFGKAVRNSADFVITTGTAQSGGVGSITLASGESAVDSIYKYAQLIITSGTGVGQVRLITSYVGSTKLCRVAPAWVVQPDNSSVYQLMPAMVHAASGWDTLHECYVGSATSTTAVISSSASTIDDYYNNQQIIIYSGTGEGQARVITDYVGSSKTVTIDLAWDTNPDSTSQYIINSGGHSHYTVELLLDEPTSNHTTAGTVGKAIIDTLEDTGTTIPATISTIDTVVDSILVDTAQIGAAGAGLTDLGGMSTAMKAEVNAEADTALTSYDAPTNTEMEARTPTAAQLAYIVSNSADGLPFTVTSGSTTTVVFASVDGSAASSVDDYYNGRLLYFNAGTLAGQVTDITDYVGSTKTATITAVTATVTSSHAGNIK